jgi:cell wall-associated NlpC family hydrolase
MTFDTDHFIGIPFVDRGYSHAGCDCWGLVRLVYAEVLGVDLPDYPISAFDAEAAAAEFPKHVDEYQRVRTPQPLDIVLISVNHGHLDHVGIYGGHGKFLHTTLRTGSVVARVVSPMWKTKVRGFYRVK